METTERAQVHKLGHSSAEGEAMSAPIPHDFIPDTAVDHDAPVCETCGESFSPDHKYYSSYVEETDRCIAALQAALDTATADHATLEAMYLRLIDEHSALERSTAPDRVVIPPYV